MIVFLTVFFSSSTDYAISHPLSPYFDPLTRLFLLPDPSHVMKRLRNCWYNREMAFGTNEKDKHTEYESSPFKIR